MDHKELTYRNKIIKLKNEAVEIGKLESEIKKVAAEIMKLKNKSKMLHIDLNKRKDSLMISLKRGGV